MELEFALCSRIWNHRRHLSFSAWNAYISTVETKKSRVNSLSISCLKYRYERARLRLVRTKNKARTLCQRENNKMAMMGFEPGSIKNVIDTEKQPPYPLQYNSFSLGYIFPQSFFKHIFVPTMFFWCCFFACHPKKCGHPWSIFRLTIFTSFVWSRSVAIILLYLPLVQTGPDGRQGWADTSQFFFFFFFLMLSPHSVIIFFISSFIVLS